jgi:hypothetical protein
MLLITATSWCTGTEVCPATENSGETCNVCSRSRTPDRSAAAVSAAAVLGELTSESSGDAPPGVGGAAVEQDSVLSKLLTGSKYSCLRASCKLSAWLMMLVNTPAQPKW